MPARVLSLAAPLLCSCFATAAAAQVGVSVFAESDDRVRGVSLSQGRPVAGLTVAYDHDSGAYLSVTGLAGALPHAGFDALGYQASLGYAYRAPSGVNFDVGATTAQYSQYYGAKYAVDYSEVYAGVAFKGLSAHLYYSPNYLGEGGRTLYAEVDGAVRPSPRWRLFGHLGLLTPLDRRPGLDNSPRYDLQAGAAVALNPIELRLAWSDIESGADYPGGQAHSPQALVLSATYAF